MASCWALARSPLQMDDRPYARTAKSTQWQVRLAASPLRQQVAAGALRRRVIVSRTIRLLDRSLLLTVCEGSRR